MTCRMGKGILQHQDSNSSVISYGNEDLAQTRDLSQVSQSSSCYPLVTLYDPCVQESHLGSLFPDPSFSHYMTIVYMNHIWEVTLPPQ